MRILIISKEGDGLGVGQRLVEEGHAVDVFIQEERFKRAGQGIVNRVGSWRAALPKADLVISDMVGFGRFEELLRKLGKPYLSCNKYVEAIELDRRKGMELFQRAGIKVPETFTFDKVSDAKKLPSEVGFKDGLVIKPDGNLGTNLTMVVKDEDQWLPSLAKLPAECSLIVQRVVSGVEVSTEGWFNGRNFIKPFNHTFEEKRFLAGDLGCNTGCMGNVVLAVDGDRLTKHTVERLEPFLKMVGYRGPFDINCIVNSTGAYALEATSRMGYDAVEALLEGLQEPAGDFLFEVAMGIKKEMDLTRDTMIAVRMSIPPWPMKKPAPDEWGEPVTGFDLKHCYLTDVYKKDGRYYTAGGDGVLLKATAIGRATQKQSGSDTFTDYTREAQRRVYRHLEAINTSSKQYRIDIGKRVNEDMRTLREQGWV